ncbi:MAG: transposase [Verrucomicrobiaceae bacterium]
MPDFFDKSQEVAKTHHNLTHWQQDQTWIFLTWRLADSIPLPVLNKWKGQRGDFLACHPKPWDQKTEADFHRRFTMTLEQHLDDAHGSCCLADHHKTVADAFHHFDGTRYHLDSFVVMPNHVHLLLQPIEEQSLDQIVHSLKSFTSKEINKTLKQSGTLWQADYWDRLIRTQKHFDWTKKYIEKNPAELKLGTFHLYSK